MSLCYEVAKLDVELIWWRGDWWIDEVECLPASIELLNAHQCMSHSHFRGFKTLGEH